MIYINFLFSFYTFIIVKVLFAFKVAISPSVFRAVGIVIVIILLIIYANTVSSKVVSPKLIQEDKSILVKLVHP